MIMRTRIATVQLRFPRASVRLCRRSLDAFSRRGPVEERATPIAVSSWETEEFLCEVLAVTSTGAMDASEDARGVLAGM